MNRQVALSSSVRKRKFVYLIHRFSTAVLSYVSQTLSAPVDNGGLVAITLSSTTYDSSRLISLSSSVIVGVSQHFSLRSYVSTNPTSRASVSLVSSFREHPFTEVSLVSSRNFSAQGVFQFKSTQVISSRPKFYFSTEVSKTSFKSFILKSTTIKMTHNDSMSISLASTTVVRGDFYPNRFIDSQDRISVTSSISSSGSSTDDIFGVLPLEIVSSMYTMNATAEAIGDFKAIPNPYFFSLATPSSRLRSLKIIEPSSVSIEDVIVSISYQELHQVGFIMNLSITNTVIDMENFSGDNFVVPMVNTEMLLHKPDMILNLTSNHTAFNVGWANFGLILGRVSFIEYVPPEKLLITRLYDVVSFAPQRLYVSDSLMNIYVGGAIDTSMDIIGSLEYSRFDSFDLTIPPSERRINISRSFLNNVLSHPRISRLSNVVADYSNSPLVKEKESMPMYSSYAKELDRGIIASEYEDIVYIGTERDIFFYLMSTDTKEPIYFLTEDFETNIYDPQTKEVTGTETTNRRVEYINDSVTLVGGLRIHSSIDIYPSKGIDGRFSIQTKEEYIDSSNGILVSFSNRGGWTVDTSVSFDMHLETTKKIYVGGAESSEFYMQINNFFDGDIASFDVVIEKVF